MPPCNIATLAVQLTLIAFPLVWTSLIPGRHMNLSCMTSAHDRDCAIVGSMYTVTIFNAKLHRSNQIRLP